MSDKAIGGVPAATTWQVTSQVEGSQILPGMGVTRGVTVYFTTGQGNAGSVFVPLASYETAKVRALVAARAAQVDEIGNLSSGG